MTQLAVNGSRPEEDSIMTSVQIEIDSEFAAIAPPLSEEEREQLEQNLVAEGCRDALVVWDKLLVDGHNRYEICTRINIPFRVEQRAFDSREDVVSWIVDNQLGRRNLTVVARIELANKKVDALKVKAENNLRLGAQMTHEKLGRGNKDMPFQNSEKASSEPIKPINVTKAISDISGLSVDTVSRVTTMLKSPVVPDDLKDALRKGDVSVNEAYQQVRDEKRKAKQEAESARLQIEACPYDHLKAKLEAGEDPIQLEALMDTLNSADPYVRSVMIAADIKDRTLIKRLSELYVNRRDTAEEILTTGYIQYADGSAIKLRDATARDLQKLLSEKWREHIARSLETRNGEAVSVVVFDKDSEATLRALESVLGEETLLGLARLVLRKYAEHG